MRLKYLKLKTNKFNEMKSFYSKVLQLPIIEEGNQLFSVAAGETVICYESYDKSTFYHYAFFVNIQHFDNLIKELTIHTPLLEDTEGQVEFFSGMWQRRQVYFKDPQGNILEILPTDEKKSNNNIWIRIQEFGIPVENTDEFIMQINNISNIYTSNETEVFSFYGNEVGVFVIVKEGRPWFPTNQPAVSVPAEVVILDDLSMNIEYKNIKINVNKKS